MPWVEQLHEDFSSGLGDLLSDAGNGSISVTGGQLAMSNPNGVNCDWWLSTAQNGPSVYREFGRYRQSGSEIYMVEIYLSEHNKTSGSTQSAVMFVVEEDSQNYYFMENFWENTDYWGVGKIIGDTLTNLWTGDWIGKYRPGWARLYVNMGVERIWPIEWGECLEPGDIGLAFSKDYNDWSGSVFQYSNPEIFGAAPGVLKFRIIKKNFGSFPESDAKFDDLRVFEWKLNQWKLDGTRGGQTAGIEDSAVFDVPEKKIEPRQIEPIDAYIEDTSHHDTKSVSIPQQTRHWYPTIPTGYLVGIDEQPGYQTIPSSGLEDEGEEDWVVGGPVQFRQDTLDPQAHVHFSGLNPIAMFYYMTEGEPWANPTTSGFTGFARDGTSYTGGVQDGGPIQAPWAQESAGGNRSARDDFPIESLLVVTQEELVIFDMDDFPNSLVVWMRFEINPNYYMVGKGEGYVTSVKMANGAFAISMRHNGTENGGVIIVDFKQDGSNDCAHLIRSDNHYWWATSYDIRDRNSNRWTTSGVSPSLRLNSEYMYSVAIYDDHDGKSWIACGGEDAGPQIIGIEDGRPMWVSSSNGPELGEDDIGNARHVLIDESGWLWFAIENRLYRSVFDYKQGVLIADQTRKRQKGVTFINMQITALAQARNYVYVGTNRGVYRIEKASLESNLAYTISGGGGGGYANNPPDGEILVGTQPEIKYLHALSTDKSSVLQVCTIAETGKRGGVTTIRLLDDLIINSQVYPDIAEDSVYCAASTIGTNP